MANIIQKKKLLIGLSVLVLVVVLVTTTLGLKQGAHNRSVNEADRALFIVSKRDLSGEATIGNRNRLEVLRDIVRSNWIQEIDIQTFDEVSASVSSHGAEVFDPYTTLFVIDVGITDIPENIQHVLKESSKRTIFIGYNFLSEAERGSVGSGTELIHEGIEFAYKGAFIFPRSILSEEAVSPDANLENLAYLRLSSGERIPFVSRAPSRLFVSLELPNYYETDSHSTIFLSVLEDFLGCEDECAAEGKRALLRLEDVNPFTYKHPDHLREVFSFLSDNGGAFSAALIPRYLNPQKNVDIELASSTDLLALLNEYVESGNVVLVQHGYTHQFRDGESGIDSEFWDVSTNSPIPNDSVEYVEERVRAARAAVEASGLPVPEIWETPHYALSELDSEVINGLYSYRYERTQEFGSLPFVFTRYYDNGDVVTYIPENLNFIETEEDFARIGKRLNQLSTIQAAVPSLFWHPWRDMSELQRIHEMFSERGYVFASPWSLVRGR